MEAAWSASRTKNSEFESRYRKFHPRLGHKRALVAIAHGLVIRIYEVLPSAQPYEPPEGLPPANIKRLVRHHNRRLNCLHQWLAESQER